MGNQVASQSIRYQSSDAAQQPPSKSHNFEAVKEKSQLTQNKLKKRNIFEVSGRDEFESLIENYYLSWDSVFSSAENLNHAIVELNILFSGDF